MIAGGNLGLHNRKNRTGNGKYKELFLFLKVFKKSQLFKAKVIAIYLIINRLCKLIHDL